MNQAIQTHDARCHVRAQHPALPADMTKWDALRLVRELRQELGLSRTACEVLEKLAAAAPAADWNDPTCIPVNFRRQSDMAEEVGVTARQFRAIEARLEGTGLIERRVASNGYRGRTSGSDGRSGVAGISLAPLIARVPELVDRAAALEKEREARVAMRLDIRVAWRVLMQLLRKPAAAQLRDASLVFEPPKRHILNRLDATALCQCLHRIREAVEKIRAHLKRSQKTSGAAEASFRCHTEDTTGNRLKACRGEPSKSTAGELVGARRQASPNGACREEKLGSSELRVSGRRLSLTPRALRDMGSEELRFYIDNVSRPGRPATMRDVEQAVLWRLRELDISPSAYKEAQEQMGWFDAMLAVIVIDRNRHHPATPIRNPGGTLRAFTRRRRAGMLHLAASVFGIWQRQA